MPVAAGRVYREFVARNGKRVTLRAARWEDLDALFEFANELVREQAEDPGFGTLIDGPVTREREARWLADKLVAIETGRELSVVAEVEGRMAANAEVVRGALQTTAKHGVLGISVSRAYRGMGIGGAMLSCLKDLSKDAGLETLELQVLGTNTRALALYERSGFRQAGLVERKYRRGGRAIDSIIMALSL